LSDEFSVDDTQIAAWASMNSFRAKDGARLGPQWRARFFHGEGLLTVADNGRGIKVGNPTGSGLKLIAALARETFASAASARS
jgi:hypothetical protein